MKKLIVLNIANCRNATKNCKFNESEKWNIRRTSKPKLRYYNMFKSDLEIEDYLFFKVPKMHRSLIAKFRAGILSLNKEVGRYQNVPQEERLCTLCDDKVVEDEIHLNCVHANNIRRRKMYYFTGSHCVWWFLPNGRFGKICTYDEQYAARRYVFLLYKLPTREKPNYTPGYLGQGVSSIVCRGSQCNIGSALFHWAPFHIFVAGTLTRVLPGRHYNQWGQWMAPARYRSTYLTLAIKLISPNK